MAFVFPGQGSQRLNAGEQWRGRFGFIDHLWREFDATLADTLGKPLSAQVFRDAHRESPATQRAMAAELAETAVAQPAIVAGSIASAELLKYFGIEPDLCLGHSLGEYSALWCAGALPAARTVALVARRGAAMTGADGARGAMLSVAAAPEQVEALLAQAGGYLTVANFNAPRQTVVSGDAEAIAALRRLCQAAAIDSTLLPVSNAFHSRYMAQAQQTMLGHLERTELAPLKRLLISSTSGELVGGAQDLRATLGGQITAPVQFVRAVETALAEDCDLFVEVGPGSIASRLTRHIVGARKARVFATDSANPETATAELNELLAFGFASGLPVRTGRVFEGRHTKPISLPYEASFITSPCELPVTPLQLDGVGAIELAGGQRSAASATPRAKAAPAAAMAWTADTVLPMMQQYIVSKFGYPIEMVHAGAMLQEDLSLDSIKSVEVVSEGMARLGVTGDPTTLVTLNLAQIAQRLSLAKAELDAGMAPAQPGKHDMPDWTRSFEVALLPQAIEAGAPGAAHRYALVDGGDAALAQAVRAQLEAAGHTVAALALPLAAGAFDGASGCLLVLGHDAGDDGAVLAAGDPFATPMLLLDSAQAFLKQLKSTPHAAPVFAVLTRGNGSLGRHAETACRVDQLAAAGFVKTLALENPALRTRYVELHRDIANATAAALVAAELDAGAPFAEAAYPDAATRLLPQLRLRTLASLPARTQPAFEAGEVLVISGGAGGITAECALDIAARYGLRLALLGSTALADAAQRKPSLLANLQRFSDAGIVFQYYQCDLTDAGQVREVMARVGAELGPVSALMHAAGLNRAHRIDKLAPSEFLAVMKPKILGLQNLLAAVELPRIKTIIAFSSIIAKSGMAGNADYSYANEWMNGVLNRIRALHPQVRCLSYNFSVWAEVGMGVDSVAHLGKLGIDPIPLRDGVLHASALLEREWPAAELIVSSRLGGLATVRFETPPLPAQRFLETIVSHQPGVELVAEAMLKPELDHYLSDHNYQGSLLFPAVLGMEAMVQAACACVGETPASVLVALENVQFHKPIVVPAEGRAIRVYAQVLADRADEAGVQRLRVAIRSSVTNYESDYFVADCVLSAAEFPEQVNDALWPAPLSVDPQDFLYGSVFFQGPMFQNISSFHSLSSRHCMVKVDPPAATLVFDPASGHGTIFGAPEVRDCYLHAVQACVPQHRILPVGIERIVTRAAGGQLFMSAKERYHVDNEYCYDLEVFDADGYLVELLQGFRCRILEAYTDTVALEKIAGIHQEAADRARLHEQEGAAA
ncbi:SDR family NAD(P)-dependent oxidoreductase [Duganella sp. HH101]|uniref:SDR family NAD(P)-dependent oxidoreductase n=1 Tax=Duganella sp. HH101 TaxID=1781066 RepID=UPI001E4B6492|nr:SDR family NAD(P)-dependent oxidoreductase [Duganella sp. HH101]